MSDGASAEPALLNARFVNTETAENDLFSVTISFSA